MALLKDDGRLDIESINALKQDDYVRAISHLTQKQRKEYLSKLPINESNTIIRALVVDSLDDYLRDGEWVDAEDFLNNLDRN